MYIKKTAIRCWRWNMLKQWQLGMGNASWFLSISMKPSCTFATENTIKIPSEQRSFSYFACYARDTNYTYKLISILGSLEKGWKLFCIFIIVVVVVAAIFFPIFILITCVINVHRPAYQSTKFIRGTSTHTHTHVTICLCRLRFTAKILRVIGNLN